MAQLTPTNDRFIAYFDIMGFKDLIYRTPHEDVSRIMDDVCVIAAAIKQSESKNFEEQHEAESSEVDKSVIVPSVFSDSILFVSESDTPADASRIIFTSTFFLCQLMKKKIPVKGALSHGKFTADFYKSSFFGRPLVDAYLLAEETHFYGATLHNSIEKFLHNLDHYIPPDFFRTTKVPMKSGNITHTFLNWPHYLKSIDSKDSDHNAWRDIVSSFYHDSSGSVRRYVDNTILAYE